jgi:alpha-amylase
MSSYAFDRDSQASRDAGPPAGGGGTGPLACAASLETATTGEWVCEHRDPAIAAMVRFRRVVAGAPMADWWDDGGNAIAFSRGNLGFVAINLEDTTVAVDVATPLTPGTYCDALTGGLGAAGCVGWSVVVDSAGRARLDLEPRRAVTLHAATRLAPSPARAQGRPKPTRSP